MDRGEGWRTVRLTGTLGPAETDALVLVLGVRAITNATMEYFLDDVAVRWRPGGS